METRPAGASRKILKQASESREPPDRDTVLIPDLPPEGLVERNLPVQAEPSTIAIEIRTSPAERKRRKPKMSPLAKDALAIVPAIEARATEIGTLVQRFRESRDVAFSKAIGAIGRECSQRFRALLDPPIEESAVTITESRRRAQRARAKREELATLSLELKSLAHDLKNLGNIISGYADLITEGIGSEEYLGRIEQNAKRMTAMTARFAAAVSGRSADRTMVAIHDAVGRVLEDRVPQLRAAGIRLEAVIENDGIAMAASGDLERVIDNFVLNAAQAGAQQISVRVSSSGDRIEVRVSDDGPGVPPEVLARLFSDAVTTKSTGNGIGTLGAAQIIRALRGDIGAESELGHGASFWFRLPRVEA